MLYFGPFLECASRLVPFMHCGANNSTDRSYQQLDDTRCALLCETITIIRSYVLRMLSFAGQFINISMGQGQEKPAEGVVER